MLIFIDPSFKITLSFSLIVAILNIEIFFSLRPLLAKTFIPKLPTTNITVFSCLKLIYTDATVIACQLRPTIVLKSASDPRQISLFVVATLPQQGQFSFVVHKYTS